MFYFIQSASLWWEMEQAMMVVIFCVSSLWTATSKYHLINEAEHDTGKVSFKGEALSSLSDISLVEVRTKARGRPNAYCKIIKACLSFDFEV